MRHSLKHQVNQILVSPFWYACFGPSFTALDPLGRLHLMVNFCLSIEKIREKGKSTDKASGDQTQFPNFSPSVFLCFHLWTKVSGVEKKSCIIFNSLMRSSNADTPFGTAFPFYYNCSVKKKPYSNFLSPEVT